jgi:hypothetical protein
MGWLSASPSLSSWISTSFSSRGAPSLLRARRAQCQWPQIRQKPQERIQVLPQHTHSLPRNELRPPMRPGLPPMRHLCLMAQFLPILHRHRHLCPHTGLPLCSVGQFYLRYRNSKGIPIRCLIPSSVPFMQVIQGMLVSTKAHPALVALLHNR